VFGVGERGVDDRGAPRCRRRRRLGKLFVQRVSRECFPIHIPCNGFSFAVSGLGDRWEEGRGERTKFASLNCNKGSRPGRERKSNA